MTNILFQLFIVFFKIGAFTFGGGWALISIIEKEIVDKKHWVTKEEFLELLAVAQSIPGILEVNMAVAVGDKIRGRRGAIISALGTIIPSFSMILFIAIFLTPDMIKNNETLNNIFRGIRPAVVALIIAPVFKTAKVAKIGWKTVAIPIVIALLIWSKLPYVSNPIIFIVLGGLVGYLWLRRQHSRLNQRKEEVE